MFLEVACVRGQKVQILWKKQNVKITLGSHGVCLRGKEVKNHKTPPQPKKPRNLVGIGLLTAFFSVVSKYLPASGFLENVCNTECQKHSVVFLIPQKAVVLHSLTLDLRYALECF